MRRTLLRLLTLAGGFAATAAAAASFQDSPIQKAYPPAALQQRIEGRAMINCLVTEKAGLTQCRVVSESPEGYGFGEAALQVSATYKVDPGVRAGQTGDVRITIPIDFRLPKAPIVRPDVRDATRLPHG